MEFTGFVTCRSCSAGFARVLAAHDNRPRVWGAQPRVSCTGAWLAGGMVMAVQGSSWRALLLGLAAADARGIEHAVTVDRAFHVAS